MDTTSDDLVRRRGKNEADCSEVAWKNLLIGDLKGNLVNMVLICFGHFGGRNEYLHRWTPATGQFKNTGVEYQYLKNRCHTCYEKEYFVVYFHRFLTGKRY